VRVWPGARFSQFAGWAGDGFDFDWMMRSWPRFCTDLAASSRKSADEPSLEVGERPVKVMAIEVVPVCRVTVRMSPSENHCPETAK